MSFVTRLPHSFAATALAALALSACADPATAPHSMLAARSALALVPGPDGPHTATVCVDAASVPGIYTFATTASGATHSSDLPVASASLAPGQCKVVYTRVDADYDANMVDGSVVVHSVVTTPGGAQLTLITTSGGSLATSSSVAGGWSDLPINASHSAVATFVTHEAPHVAVCDFITFGRLVTSYNGQKVVVSGNAGGNQPGGGILGEFHIEVNGVDNHVADIASYGPIASGPLSGAAYPNARIVTGTAKNGAAVALRLYDGGEPGKGTDVIYFSVGGTAYGPLSIDQGNMQYHPQCRGPS